MFVDEKKIKNLISDGLCTDGAHHKQWYLEEIGKVCGMKIEIENRIGVNKGIAP